MNRDWIRGKKVAIVCASDDVGKHLAFNLILKYNCTIYAISNNERQMLEFYEKLGEYKDNLEYYIFDACKESAWIDFAKSMEENGKSIDVLINCQEEIPEFRHFHKYTSKELNNVMNINFYASVYAVQHLLPLLKETKEPCIINITCISTLLAVGGTSIYCASKSALKAYTEVLSSELDDFYVGIVIFGNVGGNRYKNQNNNISKQLLQKALSPNIVANKIIEGMRTKRRRIVVGAKTKVLHFFARAFPYKTSLYIKKRNINRGISFLKDDNKNLASN